METKECKTCHQILPIYEFVRDSSFSDRKIIAYTNQCKPCYNKHAKELLVIRNVEKLKKKKQFESAQSGSEYIVKVYDYGNKPFKKKYKRTYDRSDF